MGQAEGSGSFLYLLPPPQTPRLTYQRSVGPEGPVKALL